MLPIRDLDLSAPGSSQAMKHAVQSTFCVATYVISHGVSKDIADSVIVPLIARIEHFGSARIHPELGAEEVFNLALGMSKGGRGQEALRCLDVLQDTVVRLQRPVLFLKYMTLHNTAMDSGSPQDIKRALAFYDATPELQRDSNVSRGAADLRAKERPAQPSQPAAPPQPKASPRSAPTRTSDDGAASLADKILEQYHRSGGTFGR